MTRPEVVITVEPATSPAGCYVGLIDGRRLELIEPLVDVVKRIEDATPQQHEQVVHYIDVGTIATNKIPAFLDEYRKSLGEGAKDWMFIPRRTGGTCIEVVRTTQIKSVAELIAEALAAAGVTA